MKKNCFVFTLVSLFALTVTGYAEETAATVVEKSADTAVAQAVVESVPASRSEVEAPVVPAPAAEAELPALALTANTVVSESAIQTENLEFVSGEITEISEINKTVSLKMYGENENEADGKVLTVTTDLNTDLTDGEQDRDLKSLTPGTEIDVEYDPATNKATYIFIY